MFVGIRNAHLHPASGRLLTKGGYAINGIKCLVSQTLVTSNNHCDLWQHRVFMLKLQGIIFLHYRRGKITICGVKSVYRGEEHREFLPQWIILSFSLRSGFTPQHCCFISVSPPSLTCFQTQKTDLIVERLQYIYSAPNTRQKLATSWWTE